MVVWVRSSLEYYLTGLQEAQMVQSLKCAQVV